MKDFAKSIRTMNSNKEEIIKKKKEAGATLKVDNGQKLEFSDGTTYVKTSFSDDYREAHNYTGNSKIGNSSKFDALESSILEASGYAENAYRRLNSTYSATNIISELSHCKQACDIAIKRAQEYDKELQSKK